MQLQIALAPLHEAQKKTLEEDIHDMNHMIEAYLEFARGDVGEQPESMDIAACVNDVVTRYHDSGKPVYLKPISDEMRVILLLRPHAIKRCLTNLIDNALRYGQHAHVEMETGAVAVRIRIEDAGNGIPENAQAEVFKPFTRLEASRNSKTGGIGLGLSIARDIAHAHGGEITLENKRDAAGNILGLLATLRLPRGSMR
jgi:two-component system osmolarity sensor histidine kinase EnvZ